MRARTNGRQGLRARADVPVTLMWGWRPDNSLPKNATARPSPDPVPHLQRYFSRISLITPARPELGAWLADEDLPGLKEMYELAKSRCKWIVLADLIRLVAVFHMGGLYLDADCFPEQGLAAQLQGEVVLFKEMTVDPTTLGPREDKSPASAVRVANFARRPRNPFIRACILECVRRLREILVEENRESVHTDADILWVCGPDVITTVFHKRQGLTGRTRLLTASIAGHRAAGTWRHN